MYLSQHPVLNTEQYYEPVIVKSLWKYANKQTFTKN